MDMQSTDTPPDVIRFAARDGRALTGTMFHPANTARANVIVHGATAVPRRHYDAFAQHLAGIGYRVFTYDYRGVGDSAEGHARTDGATMTDWFEHDAPAAVKVLVNRGPSLPLLAIGHSFGGQIAACLDGVPKPDAIVTTGAQRGYWATFDWKARPKMFFNWFVLLPLVTSALGYVPAKAGLGVDMPAGVISEWAKWCKNPRYFFEDHPELEIRMRRFDGRLVALSVTDDAFAPLANVEWLIDRHRGAKREHLRFTPADAGTKAFGHFGFFRSSSKDSVWPELVGALDEAIGHGQRPRTLGRAMPVRPAPEALTDPDVMGDLAHGQS